MPITRNIRVKRKAQSSPNFIGKKAKTSVNTKSGGNQADISVNGPVDNIISPKNPLLELWSNNYGSTDQFTINDLAFMFKSLSETISVLQNQNLELIDYNKALSDKVSKLENHVDALQSAMTNLTSNTKSYAQAVGSSSTIVKNFASAVASTIAAPEAQLSLMKAASYAQSIEARKANVLIKNLDLTNKAIDEGALAEQIATHCGTEKPTVFRLPLKTKGPPIVRLTFGRKMEAEKVLTLFDSVKSHIQGCLNATPRPDLSKPELAKYRSSWKEAIQKNNEAEARVYTVRNLEVVKIHYKENQAPWLWAIKTTVPSF